VPLVVLAIIGGLVGGVTFAGHTVGLGLPRTAATAFLPADGTAAYERVETTRESKTTVSHQVTESARLSGVTGLLSTDTKFGTQLFAETYDERDTLRIWRTTSNSYNDPAAPYATTRMYRVNAAVELLGESRPGAAYVYRPALVELPTDVRAGSRWSGAGSANDVLDYRSEFRAEANHGCLDVTGEVRYLSKQGQAGLLVHLERTWCPGRGMVRAIESVADIVTETSLATGPTPQVRTTTESPLRWTAPGRWVAHSYDTISVDPTFGQGPMSGSPRSLAPVRTDSGLVVRATSSLNDLIAITPKTRTEWVSVWRSHVPGEILTMRAFGDVIIVTTSTRRLVAYTDLGIRLWQLDLNEIAPAPPVRVSDLDVVVVDLAGEVFRLDIATGVVVWQRSLGSDATVVPAVGKGLVVAMDRGGTVTALDATTGDRKWTAELEGLAAGFVGDILVVLQDQTAHGLDPATGKRRWLRPFFGTFTELAPFGDRLVLATENATVLLDQTGRVTSRLPGY
ncbi:MAG TPA: PQQ-binding-like beta-propeller repeat protein, partial [Propionibacteriaceae bacterium]|nr:PQQ-binding-like beta-propeller repeat protein [Propionibacteriaceae bacterium]